MNLTSMALEFMLSAMRQVHLPAKGAVTDIVLEGLLRAEVQLPEITPTVMCAH